MRHAIKSKACQIREREKRELLLYIWEKQCIEGNIESLRILQNFGMAVPLLLIPFFLKPLLFLLSFSVDKKLDPFSHRCPLSDLSFDRAPTDNLVRQVKSQVITKEELDPSLIYNESQISFFFFSIGNCSDQFYKTRHLSAGYRNSRFCPDVISEKLDFKRDERITEKLIKLKKN